jgi:hypothetical protein
MVGGRISGNHAKTRENIGVGDDAAVGENTLASELKTAIPGDERKLPLIYTLMLRALLRELTVGLSASMPSKIVNIENNLVHPTFRVIRQS